MILKRSLPAALLISLFLCSSAAWAAPTSGPASQEAGPEEKHFRKKASEELRKRAPTPVQNQTLLIEDSERPGSSKFFVRTIRIEGNVVVPEEKLKPLLAPCEGRAVSLAELRKLTQAITEKLRGAGYVTTRAYIPPQEVVDGVVVVQILEGKIGEVRVEGNPRSSLRTFRRRMKTREGTLLEYSTLREDIGRLNANPDRRVTAVLVPGKTTGTTDVVLRVQEKFPIHTALTANNAGTNFTGRNRQGIIIGDNNLTGQDDQLVIRSEISERADFLAVTGSYLYPVGATGSTLGVDASYADVQLGKHFRSRDIEGRAFVAGMTWAQPILSRPQWEMEWTTGFDAKRIRSRESGVDRGKDDLRVLRFGPNLLEEDVHGRTIVTSETAFGFDHFLGSSRKVDPAASRTGTGGQFFRWNLGAGRLQRLLGPFQLLLRGALQLTDDRLPPAEMMRLGGEHAVRGYPEGEFLGDCGYTATTELRLPLRHHFTWVSFFDAGGGYLRKPLIGEEEKKRLMGVGFGLRWNLSDYANAFVDLGFPIGDTSIEEDRPRVYYGLSLGF